MENNRIFLITVLLQILMNTNLQAACNQTDTNGNLVDENGKYCGTCGENCNWKIENETLKITGSEDGSIGHMDSGATYIDGVYTYIQPWKGLQSEFSKVDISGVDNIGHAAFRGPFSNVTEVTIGDSVKKVESYAFEGTKIKSIVMPDSITHVHIHAFASPVLKEVIIPDSIIYAENSYLGTNTKNLEKLKIICKGDQTKCNGLLSRYNYYDIASGEPLPFPLSENVKAATAENCASTNFYWNGKTCLREPDETKRDCCNGCGKRGNVCRRLIYTVEEAVLASNPIKNTFSIRYR